MSASDWNRRTHCYFFGFNCSAWHANTYIRIRARGQKKSNASIREEEDRHPIAAYTNIVNNIQNLSWFF